jgi:hypothetical protein
VTQEVTTVAADVVYKNGSAFVKLPVWGSYDLVARTG